MKRKKIVREGYGAGYSYTGGTRGSLSRGGFGGASNLGGPNMMYTYEIKPLNHTLEPKPSPTDQLEQIHIGSKVSGTPIISNKTATVTDNSVVSNATIEKEKTSIKNEKEPLGVEISISTDDKARTRPPRIMSIW